jgi:hypothetical protein
MIKKLFFVATILLPCTAYGADLSTNFSDGTATGIVAGGGVGWALAVLIRWASKELFRYEMPPNVAWAMATLFMAAGGWIGKKIG